MEGSLGLFASKYHQYGQPLRVYGTEQYILFLFIHMWEGNITWLKLALIDK